MRLYLVRHGEAVSSSENPARPLTSYGEVSIQRIAQYLKCEEVEVKEIFHSNKKRASQTAGIIAREINPAENTTEADNLLPDDPVNIWKEKINNIKHDIMIVGHLPFLAKLIYALLKKSQSRNSFSLKAGEVVCLEKENGNKWHLKWRKSPDEVLI